MAADRATYDLEVCILWSNGVWQIQMLLFIPQMFWCGFLLSFWGVSCRGCFHFSFIRYLADCHTVFNGNKHHYWWITVLRIDCVYASPVFISPGQRNYLVNIEILFLVFVYSCSCHGEDFMSFACIPRRSLGS